MNYRKRKQQENYNKFLKKTKYNPYSSDPEDARCPYCGLSERACSHVNGLSRGWARGACKKKHRM